MIDEKEVYKVMVYIQDRMITLNEALLDYNRYNDKSLLRSVMMRISGNSK